jgi:hypothetical protein
MSKGPGRVERIIEAVFAAEPDNAFTIEDLCDRVYPGEPIEKKHRVSVLRAAKQVAKRRDEIDTVSKTSAIGFIRVSRSRRNIAYQCCARQSKSPSDAMKSIP